MDPGQPSQSCPFLDKTRGAAELHPSTVPNLLPPTPLCPTGKAGNPPVLSTTHLTGYSSQEQAPVSFASGSVSISRPRPTALGSRSVVKSSSTVSSSAVLPSAPGLTNALPLSPSFTEPAQPRLSPQKPQNTRLSPTSQVSPTSNLSSSSQVSPTSYVSPTSHLSPTSHFSSTPQRNPLVLPSPLTQVSRISHAGVLPKPKPESDIQVSPGLQPSPSALTSSPASTDKTLPLQKPLSEDDGFRVHIVTWNVASAIPPDDIISLFGPGVTDRSTDMFVIGLQEVNSMLGLRLKDVLSTDQWSELCMETLCPFGYVLVASQRMQGVLLLVLSRFQHLPFLRGIQTQTTRTGLGGCWGNKGGVSARMMMFGHPVCFLNCHLPAHMRNLEQRVEDFESILQQQQFEGGAAVGVLDHEVVFWFGDLNFRIEGYDIHVVKSAIESNKLSLLWEKDQLNMAKSSESVLDGFTEGPLNFPPTYKFDVGTHTYDTSAKKRKPAWTDRILWRLRRTGSPVPSHNASLQRGLTSWLGGATKVVQHFYRSHMGFTISDHKPVSALFSLHFPFKVDLPLVTLEVEKEWTKVSDATARFTIASGFQRSSWDWVGLYKLGFKHHKDYAAYVWAKSDHLTEVEPNTPLDWNAPRQTAYCVTFPEEDLPREAGEYILGYYSNSMNSIVGITEPFQVHLPMCSAPAPVCPSHSDSSEVSSEDDSTLVLLGPSSRSPSPSSKVSSRRHHRHHQHQRSRSPAVPALTSTPLTSLQSLSLRPRDGPARSVSPRPATNAKKERLVSPDVLTSPSISPLSPRSPLSPGNGVSVPEALIAAILGEHRATPGQISGAVASPKPADTDL